MEYDAENRRLLVGTVPDYGRLSGAVTVFDPESLELEVYRNVVDHQSIRAIATRDGTTVLGSEVRGGLGRDPVASTAYLVRFDPESGSVIDQTSPIDGCTAIVDVTLEDQFLYGVCDPATVFGYDLDRNETVHQSTLAGFPGQITALDEGIAVATDVGVQIFDRTTFESTTLQTDRPQWYNEPMLGVGSDRLYFLDGYDLASHPFDSIGRTRAE